MQFSFLTRGVICGLAILAGFLLALAPVAASAGGAVDASSLDHKLILGYQGWFACPGDPATGGHWVHWFDGTAPTVDLLPAIDELTVAERCATALKTPAGAPVFVYSAQNPATVDRHFQWLRHYGLDGVALQRFGVALREPQARTLIDRVLANVQAAAVANGRIFFVMYDLSGLADDDLGVIAADWHRLAADGLTASPAYAHHRGRPVLALWGLGFPDRPITPGGAAMLLAALRRESAAFGGVTLLGGVPAGWRTHDFDASHDPGWDAVYRQFDIISPWAVGRYGDDRGAALFAATRIAPDIVALRGTGIDYMPVIFPGFSWHHLMDARHAPGPHPLNAIPRRCGWFFWHQVYNAVHAGAGMLYGAMFDEVDEGTALFKLAPDAAAAAPGFLTLDADGCRLPEDWYLRLSSAAAGALRGAAPLTTDLPLTLPPP